MKAISGVLIEQLTDHLRTTDALAAVRRLSFAALDADSEATVRHQLAFELFEVFGVDQVHVSLLSQDARVSQGWMYAPEEGVPSPRDEYVLSMDRASAVRAVMESGEPFVTSDAPDSELTSVELVERFNVASALFVPLAFGGEVRGTTCLVTETRREFTEDEVQLVYTLANQASAGLSVLEAKAQLAARADHQEALVEAAQALNARRDMRGVLDTLCGEADHALGGDLAGVYLIDDQGRGVATAGHGISEDSDWFGYAIQPGEGVAGQVLANGTAAVSNSYRTETRVPAPESLRPVETAVSVPVRWDGELKGALSVAFASMRRVTDEDVRTLQAIADLAAVACSNAEAFEQAQAAARTDSLTGLLNHGAMVARVDEEIDRVRREGGELSCALVDLDNFKPINDRHGHLVGDEILHALALAIRHEFRPYDGIARFGGDEFVLLLPGVAEEQAMSAADRLRAVVAEAGRAFGEVGVAVTASVGVAQWREPLAAGELLDRADRALLLAKHHGKDGAVVSSTETELELATLESGSGASSQLMAEFWNMVSRCEQPADLLQSLPPFLRRALDVEEVALYEPDSGDPAVMRRAMSARMPGNPSPSAFHRPELGVKTPVTGRLDTGALSRDSLPDLLAALGADPGEEDPAGSYAAVGLLRAGHEYGLLLARSESPHFPLGVLRLLEIVAGLAVTALVGQSGGSSPAAVAALAAAIDARDNYTHDHSEQVVELACRVAEALGLTGDALEQVRHGAMLHDVGKVLIPNEILQKPGPLNEDEWAVMREHPVIGEQILRRTPALADIAPMVRHEHERWDGGGYPDGLAGEDIPVGSRIVLACDSYNAMITERPYRDPMPHADAEAELRRCAGTQFDPAVIDALLEVLADAPPTEPLRRAAR